MTRDIFNIFKLFVLTSTILVLALTSCSEPHEKRVFTLAGLKLGMKTSEAKKLLRANGLTYQPIGRLNVWVGPYKKGRQRVIYEAVDGTIWKVFHAIDDAEASQEDNKQLVISEFGRPDEEKEIEGRRGKGLSLIYKGDRGDKTAVLTASVMDNVVTWDMVSNGIRRSAIEEAQKRQAAKQARCRELLNRPVSELSANERLEAAECATRPFFDMMNQ